MKRSIFIFAFSFLSLSLSACTPKYEKVVGADGRTFFAYGCTDHQSCIQGIYDKCASDYEIYTQAALPLIPGRAAPQAYFRGSEAASHGSRRVVFTCQPEKQMLTATDIREDLENFKDYLAKRGPLLEK